MEIKKAGILTLLMVAFLLVINVSSVFAGKPLAIHIEVEEAIGVGALEPFDASGPAVDDGVVCETGKVEDLSITSNENQGPFYTVWAHKRFYCDDGSGTFDVKMVVQLDKITNATTARWRLFGGTGDYIKLRGQGSLVGIPIIPGVSIFDIYDGQVH